MLKRREQGTFVEERLKTRYERRKTVLLLLSGIAVIGWLYIFFGSTIFTVKTIEINGTDRLDRGEVMMVVNELLKDQRQWPLRANNIFFIHTDTISSEIKDSFFLENVTVDKIYPNILRLNIQERQTSLVLLVDHSFYEIDQFGVITNEFNADEEQAILERLNSPSATRRTDAPIVKIREAYEPPVEGQEFLSEFRSKTLLDAFKVLGDLGFGYRNAVLDYATSTKLSLNMFEPYEVYFDILEPLEPQISSFYTFMDVKDPNASIREYVDARVPGKVFYK